MKYFVHHFNCSETATGGVLEKKLFSKNFAKFIGKYLCWSLVSDKAAGF